MPCSRIGWIEPLDDAAHQRGFSNGDVLHSDRVLPDGWLHCIVHVLCTFHDTKDPRREATVKELLELLQPSENDTREADWDRYVRCGLPVLLMGIAKEQHTYDEDPARVSRALDGEVY